MSKFRLDEWFPYVEFFYGIKDKDKFNLAWNYHQKRNPHHWQYFLMRDDDGPVRPVEMPEQYMKEMLCDWIGAGKAITGKNNLKEWYEENKYKMVLNNNTRIWIEGEIYK